MSLDDLATSAERRLTTVVVRFKSIGSAPIMKNNVFKVTAGNKFQAVVVFLRGQLGLKASDALVSAAPAILTTVHIYQWSLCPDAR